MIPQFDIQVRWIGLINPRRTTNKHMCKQCGNALTLQTRRSNKQQQTLLFCQTASISICQTCHHKIRKMIFNLPLTSSSSVSQFESNVLHFVIVDSYSLPEMLLANLDVLQQELARHRALLLRVRRSL